MPGSIRRILKNGARKETKPVISVVVLYPNARGSRFDLDYYCTQHIPFVVARVGAALKGITVEKGVSGEAPGSDAAHTVITRLLFDSVEAFAAAFGPHDAAITADMPNYTDIEPVVQICRMEISR
jgi:uncharacterized protein (TIGR02118 family)